MRRSPQWVQRVGTRSPRPGSNRLRQKPPPRSGGWRGWRGWPGRLLAGWLPAGWLLASLLLASLLLALPAPVRAEEPVAGIGEIIDGDSLRVGGEEIRLHGIDAWEWDQRCPDGDGGTFACGEAASRFLQEAAEGRDLLCLPVTRDSYRRLVAHCLLDGRDLGWLLAANGWAVAYTRYSGYYRLIEAEARGRRAGGWRGLPEQSPTPPARFRRARRSRAGDAR